MFVGWVLSDLPFLFLLSLLVLLVQDRQDLRERKLVDVSVGAGGYQFGLEGVLAEEHKEVEVVGDAEPADEGVVCILVEAEVLVVGS